MFVCKTGDRHVHINMSIICDIYRSSIVILGFRYFTKGNMPGFNICSNWFASVGCKNPHIDSIVSCTSSPTNSDFKFSDPPTVVFCITWVMIPILVILCYILRLVLCYISVDNI